METKKNSLEVSENKMTAGNWMTPFPHTIRADWTYRESAQKMDKLKVGSLPIIDAESRPLGLLTLQQVMKKFLAGQENEIVEGDKGWQQSMAAKAEDNLLDLFTRSHPYYLVVDEGGLLKGILTESDMVDAFSKYIHKLKQAENKAEVLNVILEKAYEGIAVVDEHGILLEFNEAYSRFTGVRQEDAIGRHVTEVIENTNLHMTVKTGIPDRGVLQTIQGQPMLVHRIPIWRDGKVAGAIGMLIFESVSEVYEIVGLLQEEQRNGSKKPQLISAKVAADSRITIDQIIGSSERILSAKRLARKAARTPATILISGDSGTGKEVFAKSIHHLSPYYNGPFISVNCGAIPEELFESELFGYEEGAFTGAKKSGKIGKFELAQNGTIFLDEIGELPLLLQAKLLRVLQEREVERVGGLKKYSINVRVIAATNRDIEKMVEAGTFREDLYYRLNIIRLHLPALRERKEDIPMLLAHFAKEACDKYGVPEKHFTPEVMEVLLDYPWKGNIRELVNLVEHTVIMSNAAVIGILDLPGKLRDGSAVAPAVRITDFKEKSERQEKNLIIETLESVHGNKSEAASKLGIHRTTLYQKLKKYEL